MASWKVTLQTTQIIDSHAQ